LIHGKFHYIGGIFTRRKKMKSIIAFTLVALAAPTFADTYVVEAYTMDFVPDVVTVQPGDVIRWEYVTGYPHDVTSGMKCSHDGYLFLDIPTGGSVEWTVPEDAPSEIPYFCELHCGSGMTGMINVELPQGSMDIGLITITNPVNATYTLNPDDTGTISIYGMVDFSSSFALGVEIEENDVDAEITVTTLGSASVNMIDIATGVDTSVTSGTYTLLSTKTYLFYGDAGDSNFDFTITWPETGFEEGVNIAGLDFSNANISSMGDAMMFTAPSPGSTGYVFLEGEGDMFLGLVGDVTSATLTLPASGDEGIVTVPAGTHIIELAGYGMLWVLEDGDGGGSDFPEDVSGDGVVDVTDLLAIIAAWGATSP
jgi:plastocyanin